jgi:hypothetical protein
MKAWYPIDIQQPGNYLLLFVFQLIIVTVGPMVNIGTDTFLTSLMIHACGEFRVLKKSLRNVKQRAVQLQDQDTGFRFLYPPQCFIVGGFQPLFYGYYECESYRNLVHTVKEVNLALF